MRLSFGSIVIKMACVGPSNAFQDSKRMLERSNYWITIAHDRVREMSILYDA